MSTSISHVEPHAFTQYKDTSAQLEQERKTLPNVALGRAKKSPSPDDMPRLTPINPLKSESHDPNTEMVQMVMDFTGPFFGFFLLMLIKVYLVIFSHS